MPVLDTDFMIAIIRENEEAVRKIGEIEAETSTNGVFTTTVNAFELFEGAFRIDAHKKGMKELEFTREFLNSMDDILGFDYEASEIAGKIMAEMAVKGTPVGMADAMIAAIAMRNNERLISRNAKHFSRIQGLALEEW
ncbi:MAG: type II toxin-antitoxin system VapC family toxin [Candidatus Micrarchaeaceae archaeon]